MRDNSIPQTAGIYGIVNTVTGRVYVGKTCRFRDRWSLHQVDLRRNDHDNDQLQADWNQHGADKFEFRVLEELGWGDFRDHGKAREYFHMACHFDNLYNIRYAAYVPELAASLRER